MKKTLILAIALTALSAQAGLMSGNMLFEKLGPRASPMEQIEALGYIKGVHDVRDGVEFCSPVRATGGQMMDIVRRTLADVPEMRHVEGSSFVVAALRNAWPCPKDKP